MESEKGCATLHGTVSQIEMAAKMIEKLVQQADLRTRQEVCFMYVPANKIGLIIGKNGETVKSICMETGTQVDLSSDDSGGDMRIFVIKGSM
jgi:polyribonucleotide nucleotidyltransferase